MSASASLGRDELYSGLGQTPMIELRYAENHMSISTNTLLPWFLLPKGASRPDVVSPIGLGKLCTTVSWNGCASYGL